MFVEKRNGNQQDFNVTKIEKAMSKAFDACGYDTTQDPDTLNKIKYLSDVAMRRIIYIYKDNVKIEQIQDIVEKILMENGEFNVAKAYIQYRHTRELARKSNTTDESILSLLRGKNKELSEENSNKSTVIASTQRDYIAGEVSRDLTRRILLPEYISKAHDEGVLHFHDADYFIQPIFNCCLINIGDMLDNGTIMNGKMIESPKSFQVACTVMTQIIAAVASNQYGGQSVDIWHLGKYLAKSREKIKKRFKNISDDISENAMNELIDIQLKEELKAGVQTIQYQVNSLMTTNGQAPFITILLHLHKDDKYINENAMIIEEVLKQRLEGIKNEAGVYTTPAFPKLVYVLDDWNNLTGGKYDYITELAARCTVKRMYPDYISAKKMKENYEGNIFSPMGCRSFLTPWKDKNGEYKFEGRFNQGAVSINLPQIGIIANGDMDIFWTLLDNRLEICKQALMCRHEALKKVSTDNSPIHWQNGCVARLPKHTSIEPLLYGGYSSISLGYIGLYELTVAMTGKSHTTEEGHAFAYEVMKYLRHKCDLWRAETNIGFSLYGTPAESLCYRFASIDKARFGDIKDITDKGYYTNSYHVDVREQINAFDKLTFESQFQPLSNGGCISYVEIPNMQHNIEAVETMIKFIYDTIQYAEFNTKSDYCHVCGFDGEIKINEDYEWECPVCHNKDKAKMNVTRRTCGYLGENFWNVGKTKEIKSRVTHV